jgi:hypothetical protein
MISTIRLLAVCLMAMQDNLKKTIAYTLAHAVPEVWPLFLALVLNFPLGESCSHQFRIIAALQSCQHKDPCLRLRVDFACSMCLTSSFLLYLAVTLDQWLTL